MCHLADSSSVFYCVQGLTLKVDGYQHIEFGTVYRGHRKVSDDEVVEMYGGTHIPLHIMNDFYGHAQGVGLVV